MFKKETQKLLFKFLERELITVLAVVVIGVGAIFSQAATADIGLGLTVVPAGGAVTVTTPNGGESWTVGTSQNITWTSVGEVVDVKIELQREVAGSWEEIVALTINDGTYPWTVTSPVTSTATIRITEVGDPAVTDSSNSTFSIAVADDGGGGGGGGVILSYPAINDVSPAIVINNSNVVLDIYGFNFLPTVSFKLNTTMLEDVEWLSATHAKATVPSGFAPGLWNLWVYNNDGTSGIWGNRVKVITPIVPEVEEPVLPPEVVIPYYDSQLVRQSLKNLLLKPNQQTTLWVEFKNTGTLPWSPYGDNPIYFGTSNPFGRESDIFLDGDWLSVTRVTKIAEVVNPGETVRLQFLITGPSKEGKYSEYFQLLTEDNMLFGDEVVWNILVKTTSGVTPIAPVIDGGTGDTGTPAPVDDVINRPTTDERVPVLQLLDNVKGVAILIAILTLLIIGLIWLFLTQMALRKFTWLKEELVTVLAILIVGTGVFWASADTGITNVGLTVIPSGGAITVTAPDGGESWTVGTSQNITWTTLGPITDVKIELQREVAGSWEEIVASTTNDGTYPWTATIPTTTTATVRISKVGDGTVNDTSDATFSIVAADSGGGGGGAVISYPAINDVSPAIVINNSNVVLDIYGFNFLPTVSFKLNTTMLEDVEWLSATHAKATVPSGFAPGLWNLWVYNNDGTSGIWGSQVEVIHTVAPDIEEPTDEIKIVDIMPKEVYIPLGTYLEARIEAPVEIAPSIIVQSREVPDLSKIELLPDLIDIITIQNVKKLFVLRAEIKPKVLLPGEYDLVVKVDPEKVIKVPKAMKAHGGDLAAEWVRQSDYPTVAPGEEFEMWVEYKNTGTIPWLKDVPAKIRLGTSGPRDRDSLFQDGSWLSNNRLSALNKDILPGSIGRFTFKMKAPSRAGTYREYVEPVAEFSEWVGPDWGVYWDITVSGGSGWSNWIKNLFKPAPKKIVPAPAVIVPKPKVDEDVFVDPFEQFFGSFTSLLGDIGGWFNGWF